MRYSLCMGVIFTLLGSLCYATKCAFVKSQASEIPLAMIVFFQGMTSLILLAPFLFRNGVAAAVQKLKTSHLPLHFLRAVASVGISFFLFASVKAISLVNAMLLANTVPFIIPFIGYCFMGAKINHRLWLPILIGLTGIAIVLKPDAQLFNPGAFFALGSAVCMSTTLLIVRRVSTIDSFEAVMFYVFFFTTILAGIAASQQWVVVNYSMMMVLLLIGLLYFLVQFLLTLALHYINAQLVSSLLYSSIVFAVLIGWGVWQVLPSATTVLGMVLTIAGGVFCIREEYRSQQHKRKPPLLVLGQEEGAVIR